MCEVNLIVCVKSCHRDRKAGFHDAIRETWGHDFKNRGIQVVFFLGHSAADYFQAHPKNDLANLQRDEVVVDAADDYMSLPHKTRGICQWAAPKIFRHLFLCDNDTFVNSAALLALPFEIFDYAGHFKGGQEEIGRTFAYRDHMGDYPNCYPWASGGMGYFISKNAATLIADTYPKVWAEDMFVGQVIGKEIEKNNMMGAALKINKVATWHFQKSPKNPEFTPALLRRIYADGTPEKLYQESK